MDTKRDIETRNDIYQFLKSFYDSVKANETIGFIFTDIAHIDWEKHIPVITDLGDSILLDNPVYHNNAMNVHYHLNKIFDLEKKTLMPC